MSSNLFFPFLLVSDYQTSAKSCLTLYLKVSIWWSHTNQTTHLTSTSITTTDDCALGYLTSVSVLWRKEGEEMEGLVVVVVDVGGVWKLHFTSPFSGSSVKEARKSLPGRWSHATWHLCDHRKVLNPCQTFCFCTRLQSFIISNIASNQHMI